MVLLVTLLDVFEDFECLLGRGRLDQHFLKTPFQSPVLFDILAVFVQGRSTDHLDFSPRQCRLEHVGRIERSGRPPGTHQGMEFVDKEDHVGILFQFVHHGLHPLLELPPVFRPGHQRTQVEGYHPFVEQDAGYLAADDAQGQTFDDGRFAHSGFTDEQRVVLLSARKDLADPLDLPGATHHWIQLILAGALGQVASEIVQHRGLALGGAGSCLPVQRPAA